MFYRLYIFQKKCLLKGSNFFQYMIVITKVTSLVISTVCADMIQYGI